MKHKTNKGLTYRTKIHGFFHYTPLSDAGVKEVIRALQEAGQEDTVIIDIDSAGGAWDGIMEVLTAVQECKGSVIGTADHQAGSMAAMILMELPTLRLGKDCEVLFRRNPFYLTRYCDERFKAYVNSGILTPNEFQELSECKDVTLTGKELTKRLETKGE